MTRFFRIFVFLSLIFSVSVGYSQSADEKYYIVFTNFEDQMAGDVEITNLFDLCYWDKLTEDVGLRKYIIKRPFGASTFAEKDITEYDVAVFPMGVHKGLDASVDGIKVLTKIKQMLDAEKGVLIIGNAVLYEAFKSGGDIQSRKFLEDYMGIDWLGRLQLLQGGTYYGFKINGYEGDPVSAGYDKVCNMSYNHNNGGFKEPMRLYPSVDVFNIKEGSKAIQFDRVVEAAGNEVTDSVFTGVRVENGKARCALWSVNFDIANTWHTWHFNVALINAIYWCVKDQPHPEQKIVAENATYDFGKIEPNQHGFLAAAVQNYGRKNLTITKSEIANFVDPDAFFITEGAGQVVLEPFDVHYINLKFSPTEPRAYSESLDIFSNAINGNITIDLYGEGGDQVFHGPKIQVSDLPVDYGTIPFGSSLSRNIAITNTGNIALVIETLKIEDDGDGHFTWTETVKVPITVQAGTTHYIKVRFTPSEELGGSYEGRIEVTSNGLNNQGKATIIVKAKGAPRDATSGITFSTNEFDFGPVAIDSDADESLYITNSGHNNLNIFQTKWEGDPENLAQFKFVDGTEKVPTLEPGNVHEMKIRFSPKSEKSYSVSLKIVSNDPVDGVATIPFRGVGFDASSVEPGASGNSALSIKASPNPVEGNTRLTYNVGKAGWLDLMVIDSQGKIVKQLFQGFVNEGEFHTSFEGDEVASGVYYVIGKINGNVTRMPLMILK
ncbi:MAG: choice-of-anchor D domain-containing protein [Candidatus Kapabacteria bacterium]|nr:choice-of-anchor D domain-containing protein [Candidatus Kapabacteria bacterium]